MDFHQPKWYSRLTKSLQLTHSQPESRFFQLATVDERGHPQVRTVVFRGLDETSHTLWIITDNRSEKIDELNKNPLASICWYFTKTREQYRLNGEIQIYPYDSMQSITLWEKLSLQGKKQFLWGKPKTLPFPYTSNELTELESPTPAQDFCAVGLQINTVDYLSLTQSAYGRPQSREIYILEEGNWHCTPVIP